MTGMSCQHDGRAVTKRWQPPRGARGNAKYEKLARVHGPGRRRRAHIAELIAHLGLEGLDIERCPGTGAGAPASEPVRPDHSRLMLPGVDGISIAARCAARARTMMCRSLCSPPARRSDKVLGWKAARTIISPSLSAFASGSPRPCAARRPREFELQAAAATSGERAVEIHGLHIDPARRRVRVKGTDVDLTAQEFRLLHVLATHPGIVVQPRSLVTRVVARSHFR